MTHERQRLSLDSMIQQANKAWHGVKVNQPDWTDGSHSLAFSAELQKEGLFFHLILNAHWEPLDFELPIFENRKTWRRWIDTALDSPNDIVPWSQAAVNGTTYRADGRSVVMLYAGGKEQSL